MQQSIAELLEELGKTPDEVAEFLRKAGVKGQRYSSKSCPVNNYLIMCGHESVRTCQDVVEDRTGKCRVDIRIPVPVACFIEEFDLGYKYEDLILNQ